MEAIDEIYHRYTFYRDKMFRKVKDVKNIKLTLNRRTTLSIGALCCLTVILLPWANLSPVSLQMKLLVMMMMVKAQFGWVDIERPYKVTNVALENLV